MGTITKRGDYQWQAKVRRRGHGTQSKTFNTKAEAEAWARMIESEMDRGVFTPRAEAERTTLSDALDRYAREVTPKKKSSAQELVRIKKWQTGTLGARYLANIKGSDLAKFRDDRRADGKAENTIRLELALLSHLFETARREWGMESLVNPVKNITLPKGSRQRDRRLEPEEETYLLAAFSETAQPGVRQIVEIALETAMRQGEILKLTWADLDLKNRVAQLHDTKNGESRRVPLSTKAVGVFKGMIRKIEDGKLDEGRIFTISQDRLIRTFQRACMLGKKQYNEDCAKTNKRPLAGFLDNLRFHDLRHEATTRFFDRSSLDIMEAAAITGHKSLQMLRRYTHLRAEDLAKKLR